MLQRKKPLKRRTALKAGRSQKRTHTPEAATLLWAVLRDREVSGLRFRQREVIGPYVVDFLCPAARLVLLIEGAQPRDGEAAWLRQNGYRVLLFAEAELRANPQVALEAVARSFELRIVPQKS